MSFLGILDLNTSMVDEHNNTNSVYKLHVLSHTVNALSAILATNPNDDDKCTTLRAELRDAFVPALGRLVDLVYGSVTRLTSSDDDDDGKKLQHSNNTKDKLQALLCDLLRLGTHATRGCESAKVGWVRSKIDDALHGGEKRGGAHVLVTCLAVFNSSTMTNDSRRPALTTEACRLLASLCRYDDFRDSAGPGPNTSSAHDHAVEFHRAGASPLLIGIAGLSTSTADLSVATAALTALRVMAVNDEIIQIMVAMGVLPIVAEALRLGVSSDGGSQGLAASSLGLLRNLCGNDEIKTNLCLGSSTATTNDQSSKSATPSVLPHVIHAMQIFPSTSLVQEHACGTFAAMALRRPNNARAILDMDGPRYVVTAMKGHVGNVNVQRQGALAIRNIVSRLLRDLPEGDCASDTTIDNGMRSSIHDAFLELGAEDVLLDDIREVLMRCSLH
jgi:hypothetical protein